MYYDKFGLNILMSFKGKISNLILLIFLLKKGGKERNNQQGVELRQNLNINGEKKFIPPLPQSVWYLGKKYKFEKVRGGGYYLWGKY